MVVDVVDLYFSFLVGFEIVWVNRYCHYILVLVDICNFAVLVIFSVDNFDLMIYNCHYIGC